MYHLNQQDQCSGRTSKVWKWPLFSNREKNGHFLSFSRVNPFLTCDPFVTTNNFWTTFECEPICRAKPHFCNHLLSVCLVSRSVIGKSYHTCQALQNQAHFFSHREKKCYIKSVWHFCEAEHGLRFCFVLSHCIISFTLALMQCHYHFICNSSSAVIEKITRCTEVVTEIDFTTLKSLQNRRFRMTLCKNNSTINVP